MDEICTNREFPDRNIAVQASGLGKRYAKLWALRDFDLKVEMGEIYGLLGPNGAGKTTTLRMIAGLLTPDQGQVLVAGKSPQIDPLYIKRTLGFLTGNTKLYQRLTPLELLHFFGTLQEMCKADINRRIEQIVAELDIGEFLKQPCGSLSTGQTQRVNIARALLHDPPILILDEPTAGLDLISADFILKVIRRCRQQHKAVIFSTHILAETELLCDRIGVLYRGKLAAEGTLEQLLAQTNTPNMANAFLQIVATSDALHANNNRDSTSENE